MAEKQGFEPWEGINPQRFSRPPLSTAQPPLQYPNIINNYSSISKPFYALLRIEFNTLFLLSCRT